MLLYRGGNMEHYNCERIGMPSFNIEQFGVLKATLHNPLDELNQHFKFLEENVYI